MSTTFNSLILAGFSGVGKDTLARMLTKDYPQVHNVKFSSLTKDIFANTFRVPRSWLDGLDSEPKWREQPLYAQGKLTKVTPYQLLASLLYGGDRTGLNKLSVDYALENIPKDSFPVFTDIRRPEEYEAVTKAGYNPLFIYLRRDDVKPGEADGEILRLAEEKAILFLNLYTCQIDRAYKSLLKAFSKHQTTLTPAKPTLHVFVGCEPKWTSLSMLNYEPMQTVLDRTRAALQLAYSLPSDVVDKRTVDLFQALVNEADLSKLELPAITSDCYMVYNDSYRSLLPRLREMARLKLYVPTNGDQLFYYCWTTEEKANADFI